jgi:beta-fructofuranosidase
VLNPDDRWIWDFWHVRADDVHHLYYLQAPKSLGDPELRHRNATVGHATSTDLTTWTEHGTVLTPGGPGDIDATATWTGSVIRGDGGLWRMYYTASTFPSSESAANIETIALAVSDDLYNWRKDPSFVITADARWYERLGDSVWPEETWRDPWVYRAAEGHWNMLITARSNAGDVMDRGVIGLATSTDLTTWTVQRPLTRPGVGFGHLEVLQAVTIQQRDYVLFSVHSAVITDERAQKGAETGTWIAPVDDKIRLDKAVNLTGPDLYSARLLEMDSAIVLLAFHAPSADGVFTGGICDPIPVLVTDDLPSLASRVRAP